MPLIDNINFLKSNFNNIYQKYKDFDESKSTENLQLVTANNEELSLLAEFDSNFISLHSRYNPTEEAQVILKEYLRDIVKYKHIVFYGVGLGYIVEQFVEFFPNKDFSIFEPIEIIFNEYISRKEIDYKNLKYICTGNDKTEISQFIEQVFQHTESGVFFIFLPSYKRIFNDRFKEFEYELDLYLKGRMSSLATDRSYQDLWIKNSIENFEYVLNTPDIFAENKKRFKGKVGILVAAGPSLDFELENLKYIKDNNMAFIFSISSATNALLKNNITPHAATSYDPQIGNLYGVFRNIIDEDMDTFPLIFGSSIYSQIIQEYKGPMAHMITNQDTISDFFLRDENGNKFEVVSDAPSIAVLTLELFYKLGCSKVILVGQNLSYYQGHNYGSNMDEDRNIEIDLNSSNIIKVKDVYGNLVPSNVGYISAKNQMESYIKLFRGIEVINTTKYGADIEGTRFMELSEVIKSYLKKDDIDTNFCKFEDTKIDIEFLKQQKDIMDKSFKSFNTIISNIESNLSKMTSLVRNNNFSQLDRMYLILNTAYNELDNNAFYKVFVLPMNRVYHKYLADKIRQTVIEKMTPYKKAEVIINEYKRFLFTCKKQVKENVLDLYEELSRMVEENTGELRGGYKIFEATFEIV